MYVYSKAMTGFKYNKGEKMDKTEKLPWEAFAANNSQGKQTLCSTCEIFTVKEIECPE